MIGSEHNTEDGALSAVDAGEGLVLEHVAKSFSGQSGRLDALCDVSLSVRRGQFVTLIGPSGSGKSTLLRIVAGLERPDVGEVSIFGESVERARENKHIGYVPQGLALLAWRNVLDNVRLPLQVNNSAGESRLRRDPAEILAALGLGEVLYKRPAELSGGMRQRVAIARAFALEPAVLLMDEPFSALDELTAETLRQELLDIWQAHRTTVLFVTHSVTEAVMLSDRVAVMTKAPGRLQSIVPIDLARPRPNLAESTSAFHDAEATVRTVLREGAADA